MRGCIGQFEDGVDVAGTVRDMAAAALRDSRFLGEPVTADELPELDIEISVLSPLRAIKDINEIEIGRHGIYLTRGWNHGVLLPPVATDTRRTSASSSAETTTSSVVTRLPSWRVTTPCPLGRS